MELQEFIDNVKQRLLPNTPAERIRILAKELAEGAVNGVWNSQFDTYTETYESGVEKILRYVPREGRVLLYLRLRWGGGILFPSFDLLQRYGYLDSGFGLTKSAFQLLEEIVSSTIFISYRRKDSSAFALLILKSLKAEGLDAFLDMSLEPGEEWHQGLKERIQQRDYFIVLIGKETLNSEVVRKEILWAMKAGSTIIPVWHNGFNGEWDGSPEIDKVLDRKHAIRVIEESTLAYNNAIVELLNRFGITP